MNPNEYERRRNGIDALCAPPGACQGNLQKITGIGRQRNFGGDGTGISIRVRVASIRAKDFFILHDKIWFAEDVDVADTTQVAVQSGRDVSDTRMCEPIFTARE